MSLQDAAEKYSSELEEKYKDIKNLDWNTYNAGYTDALANHIEETFIIGGKWQRESVWHDARRSVPEKGHYQQIICITDDGLAIRTVDRLASGTRVWCFLSDIAPKNI